MKAMNQTYLLDKALQKKSKERERLRLAIIERAKQILKEMQETIPFEKACLFGTITKPYRFSEGSDIDIAFVGLRNEDFFPALAYLSRNLGRDIDILQLEKHRLREKIIQEGIIWTKQDFQSLNPK